MSNDLEDILSQEEYRGWAGTLRERLEYIDRTSFLDKAPQARDPQALRFALAQIIWSVQQTTDYHSLVLAQLLEAVCLALNGRRHPLFAVTDDDLATARPSLSISSIQGVAAAVLEHAVIVRREPQAIAARAVAAALKTSGCRQMNGKPYGAAAVIKWRAASNKQPRHAGCDTLYDYTLRWLRHQGPNYDGFDILAKTCRDNATAARG